MESRAVDQTRGWEREGSTTEFLKYQSAGIISGRQWGAIGGFRAGGWFTRVLIFRVITYATIRCQESNGRGLRVTGESSKRI